VRKILSWVRPLASLAAGVPQGQKIAAPVIGSLNDRSGAHSVTLALPTPITASTADRPQKKAASTEVLILHGDLSHGDFGREQECRAAIVELHEQHVPTQIIDFAHD